MSRLTLETIDGLDEIRPGDDLPALLAPRVPAGPGILVVAQKIVSKAEGRIVSLSDVKPSDEARALAVRVDKDPCLVELTLRESKRVLRAVPGVLICETHHGLVCANAGIDQSNAPEGHAILLPVDPDASARRIASPLGPGRAVIVSDTFGRPWREGQVDVAIGVAGMAALDDKVGTADREGRELKVTTLARADQLAAAAGVLMEKAAGTPVIWITGIVPEGDGRLADLLRDPERDLFR